MGGLAGAARSISAPDAELLARAVSPKSAKAAVSRTALKAALAAISLTAPEVAALVLLTEGAAAIHHAHKLQQAVDAETQSRLAREVVAAVHERVDDMPPAVAARVLAALRHEFVGATAR